MTHSGRRAKGVVGETAILTIASTVAAAERVGRVRLKVVKVENASRRGSTEEGVEKRVDPRRHDSRGQWTSLVWDPKTNKERTMPTQHEVRKETPPREAEEERERRYRHFGARPPPADLV